MNSGVPLLLCKKSNKTSYWNRMYIICYLLCTNYCMLWKIWPGLTRLVWRISAYDNRAKKLAEYSAFQISFVGQGGHEKFGDRQFTTIYYSIQLKKTNHSSDLHTTTLCGQKTFFLPILISFLHLWTLLEFSGTGHLNKLVNMVVFSAGPTMFKPKNRS